jgi:monosaccharide ABC transporter substrate-binding protein, CUT2 family (TC 3.A.1.2.-)
MALGALEAIRAAGLAGKVLVVGTDGVEEMINAVKAKEAAATVINPAFWQGGMGLHGARGKNGKSMSRACRPKNAPSSPKRSR